ncbi:hypothetical protein J1N35_018441 [Gossypium stocksii]|uniref:Retrotransposon Copia-like N-terminal domain-containing protein n=1 Tax=Gossypium stocksii TaxID=47602 RepID=A0A9D3VP73_9ROSI|nr:hypothetical protein J1N35_018441 [Gossypium stocksii]
MAACNLSKIKNLNDIYGDKCVAIISSSYAATIFVNINFIPIFNGTNFKEWKRHLLIVIGYMDINLTLRKEQLVPVTTASTLDAKRDFERWDHSNCMSLMIMSTTFQKPLGAHNLKRLLWLRYKSQGNEMEYIMEMFHVSSRLKAFKIELSEELLVLMILVSLLAQFNQFKISYNCQKVNEL